jgi:hypothetical protein
VIGIFGLGRQPGQARYNGQVANLSVTESVLGTTLPILIGTKRVHSKLLDYYGFNAQKQSAPTGKGIFGSKGDFWEYYSTVVAALAQGPCQALLNVWTYNGMLENLSNVYSYTVPSLGGSVSPVSGNTAPIQVDLGVVQTGVPYSVATNDYGGAPKTLSGMQNVPLMKVPSSPGIGQYSFNSGTGTYAFGAAMAGATVAISYSSMFSLYYLVQTQFDLVPFGSPWQITPDNHDYFYQNIGVTFIDSNTPGILVSGTPSATNEYQVVIGYYVFFSGDAGRPVAIKYSYTSADSDISSSSVLNVTFFNGAQSQAPWSYSESANPSHAFGYTGICYVASENMDLGQTAQMPPYNYEVAGQEIYKGQQDALVTDAMSLILSDPMCGIDFPTNALDTAGTWANYAIPYWLANGFFISDALEAAGGISDVLARWCEAGNTAAFFSGGLLKLVPYGEVSAVGNGATYLPPTNPAAYLNWDNILLPAGQKPGSSLSDDFITTDEVAPVDQYNYVQCNWCDRLNSYNNDLLNQQNDAAIVLYGRRMESAQDWTFICLRLVAQWALASRLLRNIYINKTFKFSLTYTFDYLEPMDVLVLPTGISVRIRKIEEDENQILAIEAENFLYGASSASIYPVQQPSRYQPTQNAAPPGSTFPAFFQTYQQQKGGLGNQISIAASGDSENWGGCEVWLSIDGTDYSQIGTINEPCALGILSAMLPAMPDPDTTDTLSVDMSPSGLELVSASQSVADSFGTLCALISPDGSTVEFISYETATLTAENRYNLTYLRRGVYGSTISSFPAGSSFVYVGSYDIFAYTFQIQYLGSTVYFKFPSFNLTGQVVQPLSQCRVYPLVVGQIGVLFNETYVPSAVSVSASTGNSSVVNSTAAYDRNFATGALFSSGAGVTGAVEAVYSLFGPGSGAVPSGSTLYINWQSAIMVPGSPAPNFVYADVNFGAGNRSFVDFGETQASGTAVINVPAGTDLSVMTVTITATNENGGAAGSAQINEIWIYCPAGAVPNPGLGWSNGNNANGYWVEDPVEHIHQWGIVSTDINGGTLAVTFPKAFTDLASIDVRVTTKSSTDRITFLVDGSTTLTGFTVGNNGSGGYAYWEADGY